MLNPRTTALILSCPISGQMTIAFICHIKGNIVASMNLSYMTINEGYSTYEKVQQKSSWQISLVQHSQGKFLSAMFNLIQFLIADIYFGMEYIVDGQLLGSINGMLSGGAVLDNVGKIGKALYIDGISGYVDLGNHRDKCVANLDLCPAGITFTLWLKAEYSGNTRQFYLSNGGQSRLSHGVSLHRQDGHLRAQFRLINDCGWFLNDPITFMDDVWCHVMITWRLDVGGKLYVDGELRVEAEANSPNLHSADGPYNTFYIGRPNHNDEEHGHAWIDEIKVYYEYKDASFVSYFFP